MIIFIWLTHIVVPICIYILIVEHIGINNLFIVITIAFYALLPDLDSSESKLVRKFPLLRILSFLVNTICGHRGIIHSFLFSIIFSSPLLLLQNNIYFLVAFLSYNSHLLLDATTKTPIPILYPFKKRVALKWFKTNSVQEYVIALLCIMLIVYSKLLFK